MAEILTGGTGGRGPDRGGTGGRGPVRDDTGGRDPDRGGTGGRGPDRGPDRGGTDGRGPDRGVTRGRGPAVLPLQSNERLQWSEQYIVQDFPVLFLEWDERRCYRLC